MIGMGRAERRIIERLQQKEDREAAKVAARQFAADMARDGRFDPSKAIESPDYMAQVVVARARQREGWNKNGISYEDLKKEYQRGYDAAILDAVEHYMNFFYAGTGIALHNICGFGEMRIKRVLDELHRVMGEELSSGEIVERLKRETGLDIRIEGYAKEGVIT